MASPPAAPRSPRRQVLSGLAGLVVALLAPPFVGSVPPEILAGYAAAAALVAGTCLGLHLRRRTGLGKKIGLVVMSACLSTVVVDLAARGLFGARIWTRPDEIFFTPYPRMWLVGRYLPEVRFEADIHGDLGAVVPAGRERRRVRFVTDAFGFRNQPDEESGNRPLDVVLLGDSFGAGSGTSQEDTWASLLASRHGLKTYDLSVAGASPWQEYITLVLELDRLRVRPGTVVLWAVFTGNDLDETYEDIFDPRRLPWRGLAGDLRLALWSFRDHSVIGHAIRRVRKGVVSPEDALFERSWADGSKVLFYSLYQLRARRTPDEVRRHPNFALLERTVAAMGQVARTRSLDLVLVLLPSKEEVYPWLVEGRAPSPADLAPSGFARVLREVCDRGGVRMIDLKPALVEAARPAPDRPPRLLWWRDDTHWNPLGHELAAAEVKRQVIAPGSGR